MLPTGSLWHLRMTDNSDQPYVYTGPANEEHRIAWVLEARPGVFSAVPAGCTASFRNCHFGISCPTHPNA